MLARVKQLTDLSFVTSRTQLWTPERSGDYGSDTDRGRRYAVELMNFIRLKNCPLAFGQVMRAITEGGVYGAVEIGFCSAIGIELVGVPYVIDRVG